MSEIEKLVHGGEGLARQDGQVVLVPYVLPGETVSVTTSESKTVVARFVARSARAGSRAYRSALRYFADCGGCHLQHATYDFQLAQKRAILLETLQRIGGVRHEAK